MFGSFMAYYDNNISYANHNEVIKSDHFAIKFNIDAKGAIERTKPCKLCSRNYEIANWVNINNDFRNVIWAEYINETSINTAWLNFKLILNSICDTHIPKVTIENKNKTNYPWYDADIHNLNRAKKN